jgi:hypothetical protein
MKLKETLVIVAMIVPVLISGFSYTTVAAGSSTLPISFDYSNWPLSREQAIVIASSYLPSEVTEKASVNAGPGVLQQGDDESDLWSVSFLGVTIPRNGLGWQA